MKRIITFILLIVTVTGIAAQDNTESERYSRGYVSNYDSLMNGYYMKKYKQSSLGRNVSTTEFDKIPDSVLSQRLAALHTVIPMTYNNVVRSYIRMYLNKMASRLDVMLSLADYYYPMFEETLNRYDVPEELKHLTIVESAMNPLATSRAGAAGLWQFMYHTGKNYDMEVNSVVDDRRDPYKSTVAAARYLHDLHDVFGDWTLAIAAYNCGPGNITKAMSRYGRQGDFWQIYPYLPQETRGYIPAFIAAVYVMNYYPEHGLRPHKFTIPIHSDTVMMRDDALFCFVSQFTGISMDELRVLNPQYRADFVPGASGRYSLCVPINKIDILIRYEDSIYAYTQDSTAQKPVEVEAVSVSQSKSSASKSHKYHVVKRGETLSSIARKHGTTVKALRKKNGLRSDKIRSGQRLKL